MKSTNDDAEARLRRFAQEVAQLRRSPKASRAAVAAVKQFQRERLASAHADLLQSDRYRPASRFFLDELYGVRDVSSRDEELAKMIPSMCRLLPASVLAPLADALELDAVSEQLDEAMAVLHETGFPGDSANAAAQAGAGPAAVLPPLTETRYFDLYRAVGRRDLRVRQIELVEQVGRELDRLVAKPFLYRILKGMEGPARLAGLGRMQRFLVSGFDAFRNMRGAEDFIRTVAERERALMGVAFGEIGSPGGAPSRPATQK